ncbi:MAG: elongator complex protein 3 [Ruminococcus sp.]
MPHKGCPHQCSFCNQKEITGQAYQPTTDDVEQTIKTAINDLGDNLKNAEIAFFGGSFTAIDKDYMLALLKTANKYIDKFYGIRISTRPDCIDEEILDILKFYGVTSIELGAQSMCDDVLLANRRGHTAQHIADASVLIKSRGFSLGLQMMTGLYKSSVEKDIYTALQFIKIKPDTVRIYPTVILDNTYLGKLYKNNEYITYSLNESVDLCSRLLQMFEKNSIRIIRLGLHYSKSLEENMLYNNYHPAFKELCENKIFKDKLDEIIKEQNKSKDLNIYVNPKSMSKLIGQNKSNIKYLISLGYNVTIKENSELSKYEIVVK